MPKAPNTPIPSTVRITRRARSRRPSPTFSATNATTVLGSPKDPTTAPSETMLSAKTYAPTSCLESIRASRTLVAKPIMLAPTFPLTAQAPPESKRRLRNEPLKIPFSRGAGRVGTAPRA